MLTPEEIETTLKLFNDALQFLTEQHATAAAGTSIKATVQSKSAARGFAAKLKDLFTSKPIDLETGEGPIPTA